MRLVHKPSDESSMICDGCKVKQAKGPAAVDWINRWSAVLLGSRNSPTVPPAVQFPHRAYRAFQGHTPLNEVDVLMLDSFLSAEPAPAVCPNIVVVRECPRKGLQCEGPRLLRSSLCCCCHCWLLKHSCLSRLSCQALLLLRGWVPALLRVLPQLLLWASSPQGASWGGGRGWSRPLSSLGSYDLHSSVYSP